MPPTLYWARKECFFSFRSLPIIIKYKGRTSLKICLPLFTKFGRNSKNLYGTYPVTLAELRLAFKLSYTSYIFTTFLQKMRQAAKQESRLKKVFNSIVSKSLSTKKNLSLFFLRLLFIFFLIPLHVDNFD